MYKKIHNVCNNILQHIKYKQYNIYLSHNIFIVQMIILMSTETKWVLILSLGCLYNLISVTALTLLSVGFLLYPHQC